MHKADISVTSKSPYEKQLLDNDVKKANELIPTMMDMTVYFKTEYGYTPTHILMGVKATTHPIDSSDMKTNLINAVEEKNVFFKTVRWLTGEMKTFSDFVFNYNATKEFFEKYHSKSPWWSRLKSKKVASAIRQWTASKKQIMPNATILISMDEVEQILSEANIDLKDETIVRKVLDYLFLLGFVIIDTAAEVVYFFFDGWGDYRDWETDRKSTRLNSSHSAKSRMPSSA